MRLSSRPAINRSLTRFGHDRDIVTGEYRVMNENTDPGEGAGALPGNENPFELSPGEGAG
jgi:hypothetical protein